MANVTYLIGAGASAGKRNGNGHRTEGLPCVSDIPATIRDLIVVLSDELPINITWNNQQTGLNTRDDWEKARIELLNYFKELYLCCKENATIDTYAKKLVLTKRIKEFRHLEHLLTLFFMYEQIRHKPDSRYDTFLANILTDKLHFPDNIRVISWNYDNQFEIAYKEYNPNDHLLIGSKRTTTKVKHEIIKINGTASFLNADEDFASYRKQFLEDVQDNKDASFEASQKRRSRWVLELIYLYKHFIDGQNDNTDLSFAFDYNYPSETIIKNINDIIGDTEALVIIGYTFPFFNREIDRKMLESIDPIANIYIQDINPERIKQSLTAVLPDFPEEQIFLRKDVDQFFLPPEL